MDIKQTVPNISAYGFLAEWDFISSTIEITITGGKKFTLSPAEVQLLYDWIIKYRLD